ncbi:MAG: Fur family transcriptional regulator [Patescibacteria group bacterium]
MTASSEATTSPHSPSLPDSPAPILQRLGLKATPQRLAILGLLFNSSLPLSIKGISKQLPHIDPVTIYRNTSFLLEKGILRRVELRHGHAHYEIVKAQDHHHLICTACARVEEIAGCDIQILEDTILKKSKHFKSIHEHALEFYGLCKECSKLAK